jgi:hypothetical protein
LPLPEGPTMETNSPLFMTKLMPLKASNMPALVAKTLVMSLTY